MTVIPFIHEGLGNSSYLVTFGGRDALLVDPDRNVERYFVAARDRGLRIVGALETHLHADFVSGANELAARQTVKVFVPGDAQAHFPHVPVHTREPLTLDGFQIEPIPSPGHTREHMSYVVRPPHGPALLFSGGSLIVGGAARTDLIAPDATEALTRQQYHTIQRAFSALPNGTELYPTHGGGSFCSIGSSDRRTSTLGEERNTNPLLAIADEAEFVRWFPSTFPAAPRYFSHMRAINQAGATVRSRISLPPPLRPSEFQAASDAGSLVVDLRPAGEYSAEHIPGALSNPLRDAYATWLGWLVRLETPLLFVLGDESLSAAVDESLLVGFERFAGWLDGGMAAWRSAGLPVSTTDFIDAPLARRAIVGGAAALDVRELDEFTAGHIEGALHIPLGVLQDRVHLVPRDRPVVVYCGHGERASTAASLLERAGVGPILNIDGGFGAWSEWHGS